MSVTVAPARPPVPAEASAWGVLQRAQGFVQKWPEGFRGYRARVRGDGSDGTREGVVVVACGPDPSVDLELPGLHDLLRARLVEHADERTPRFFKDGDGRFTVRAEADTDGERWIRVERPEVTVRYRLDARGRIQVVQRFEPEREIRTVIEEYARATPGRVLPARRRTTTHDRWTGACLAREELVETHCRIEHVWLPTRWELMAETAAGSRALRLEVFAHQLL